VISKNLGQSCRAQTPNFAPRRWSISIVERMAETTVVVCTTARLLAPNHWSFLRTLPSKFYFVASASTTAPLSAAFARRSRRAFAFLRLISGPLTMAHSPAAEPVRKACLSKSEKKTRTNGLVKNTITSSWKTPPYRKAPQMDCPNHFRVKYAVLASLRH